MKMYSITYDLIKHKDYNRLFEKIKQLSYNHHWARPTQSQWLIYSILTACQIRNELQKVIDNDDIIFVIETDMIHWASFNVNKDITDWLSTFE